MRQHLGSAEKQHLSNVRVKVDGAFNESACLDLESQLIGLLAGDGAYEVLNDNHGVAERNYYDRPLYQESFREVFDKLARDGVFTRTISDIENSDLFKLSPFKSLVSDQAVAVEGILDASRRTRHHRVGHCGRTFLGETVITEAGPYAEPNRTVKAEPAKVLQWLAPPDY